MNCSPNAETDTNKAHEVVREEIHSRRIDMRGYRRSDGLFEVEGRVVDQKPFEFAPTSGGPPVASGEPIHDMTVRLIFDKDMVVHDVQSFTAAAPYPVCSGGGGLLSELVGSLIGPGWGSTVRKRLSGNRSCTHLMELLMPLATTAIQSVGGLALGRAEPTNSDGRPKKIDSCYAYAESGQIVLRRWPRFYKSK
jgi:hypothetical protein